MVRHKTRWLLVHILSSTTSTNTTTTKTTTTMEKKHLFHSLRSIIDSSFGLAGSAITESIQGK